MDDFSNITKYVDTFQVYMIVTILLVITADNIYESMTLEMLQNKFLSSWSQS